MNRRSYVGKNNPKWRGGRPKCSLCKKTLSSYASKICRPCYPKTIMGHLAYQWQEKPTYKAIHRWLEKKFIKPNKCEFCKTNPGLGKDGRTKLQWANKDGNYSRKKEDWFCLCVSCHKIYDLKRLKAI